MQQQDSIGLLLLQIDEGYNRKAWHGTNLRGSVRGLTLAQASWRPGINRHNIWEIVVHCAYWKYVVRRRILGEKRGSFPLEGSNWFARPVSATEKAWKADLALLESAHKEMRRAVAALSSNDLNTAPRGSKIDNRAIICGIAMHDVYHAGQIQMIKRLQK